MPDPCYDAAESATLLLRAYRERRQGFHLFDDYDKTMARVRASASARIATLDDPLKAIASRLFDVADKGFFLLQVCEWKLDYLAEAIVHAIDAKNPIALANNTRGLVEHLAALITLIKEFERLEERLRGQGSEKAMCAALETIEQYLYRAYYGKSPKSGAAKDERAHHVNDCLAQLKEDVPDIEDVYDFLNEYVHPNYGSNLLVSTGQLGSGRLNPPEDVHRETLDRMRRYCSLCMLLLEERGVAGAAVFIRLQALLEHFFRSGARVSNVFAIKAPQPEGDGRSKETAYWFPKARSAMEAMKLCYEVLQTGGFTVEGKEIGGIEEGFIYDVYATDRGMIWFKVPRMEL